MKKIIAVLCIVIFLSCILVEFLPHSHECPDTECTLCNIIENIRGEKLTLATCGMFLCSLYFTYLFPSRIFYLLCTQEDTLINLKVKLSA